MSREFFILKRPGNLLIANGNAIVGMEGIGNKFLQNHIGVTCEHVSKEAFSSISVILMANITELEFVALDLSGKNYLSWVLDAEIHLVSKDLGNTIKEGNKESLQDRAKALIFLCYHIHDGLKIEYLTVKDPQVLWTNLNERFDHQRTVVFPKARYEWMHLRLQDFKTVSEYNFELFIICSKLNLCGEKITDTDMLEKTFFKFHASNVLLQQQYRERSFKRLRPTGSVPFSEASGTAFPEANAISRNKHGYRRGRGHGHENERGRGRNFGQNHQQNHQQHGNNFKRHKANENNIIKKQHEESCFGCGMKGHWSRTCRTAKHLVDLY